MNLLIYIFLFILPLLSQPNRDWDDIDYEIFDLNDALLKRFGPGTTFYSVLSTIPSASISEISKAYRKSSLEFHPDKNGSPEAAKFYALLTSVSTILKDEKTREKYDGHLKRGFPIWRGSGYYYKKYRPGVGAVVFIVILFISIVQYLSSWGIYYMNIYVAKSQHEEQLALLNRKKKKNSSIEIPVLNLDFPKPNILDIALFKLPIGLVNKVLNKSGSNKSVDTDNEPVIVTKSSNKPLSKRKLKKLNSDFDPDFIE